MEAQFFESASALRQWFVENHLHAPELWVGIYKKASGRPSVTWADLKDELLCFGWAEGQMKSMDSKSFAVRITPRKSKSKWSPNNIQKAKILIDMGLMETAGIKAFEERDLKYEEEYRNRVEELSPEFMEKLKSHPAAYHYFEHEMPSYRKSASRWVMSAKQEATRLRRLESLIESSAEGLRIPPMRSGKKSSS